MVTLRCDMCGRLLEGVPSDPTDPPGTLIVEAPCDRCDDGGLKPETRYFDTNGKQLGLEPY